jgi:hypothetical protein
MRMLLAALTASSALSLSSPAEAAPQEPSTAPRTRFTNGLSQDPTFFPIGVWLQAPQRAARYRELGINLYVGLWDGPTKAQLDELDAAGMQVICAQNEVGLQHGGKTIVGWMHDDEPDNAQKATIGYGPPVEPHVVVAGYEQLRKLDPTRPVLLNLGQGVAWDGWHGRGVRTNHPEDYPEYCKGADIVGFDIYPVSHDKPAVQGKLEFVGRGVQRLVGWTQGKKPVWACIETTHVNGRTRPTPAQVRSEVWMAIACGASGIVYFAHEFEPKFAEAGLLAYPEIVAGVAAVNAEVRSLAPILCRPQARDAVSVQVDGGGEVAVRAHRDGKDLVVVAASLAATPVQATFMVAGHRSGKVLRLGEERPAKLAEGRFAEMFAPYGIGLYRITP